MGKKLDYVQESPTGRLIYRRVYPVELRPFLHPKPRRELKVTLKAKGGISAAAWQRWEQAQRDFERDIAEATAARELHRKKEAGRFDALTAGLRAYLVEAWRAHHLATDEEVRWLPRPIDRKRVANQTMRDDIAQDLAEAIELRALADIDGITRLWRTQAVEHAGT